MRGGGEGSFENPEDSDNEIDCQTDFSVALETLPEVKVVLARRFLAT